MALNFPNVSRSYDAHRRCVRFWGYDETFEVCFFVEQDAFSRLNPGSNADEAGLLSLFDRYRDKILAAARDAYRRQRKDAYTLVASDF